ncbi:hypothetical protein GT347_03520 [Xylophilus rhododendri]|uniref:Uncharacterized protein n=1 Tax=Xylophilus rhododendri TaxID=2697032 RepID=A0A857J0L0_9BURK|nr:hypothetical protein [Xylophilus rhododendri]QHI97127.1 hypothetical protein GT347_03520 [Xylophilus rhododendri]
MAAADDFAAPADTGTDNPFQRALNLTAVRLYTQGVILPGELQAQTEAAIHAHGADAPAAVACILLAMGASNPRRPCPFLPGATCFTSAMNACANAGQPREALKLLDLLETRAALRGFPPTLMHYEIAMKACMRRKLWHEALEVFDAAAARLSATGVSSFLYSTASHACEKSKDTARGARLQAMRAAAALQEPRLQARGADIAHSIRSLLEEKRAHEALAMVGDYFWGRFRSTVEPDSHLCSAAIEAFGMAGMTECALGLFWQLQPADPRVRLRVFEFAVHVCHQTGRQDLVALLLRQGIDEGSLRPQLGLLIACNELDFHRNAIYAVLHPGNEGGRENHGVHCGMALGIFEHFRLLGLINPKTRFVVGRHGTGALREAIAQRILQLGCWPVAGTAADGTGNPGVLTARHAPPPGKTAGRQPDPLGEWSRNHPAREPDRPD